MSRRRSKTDDPKASPSFAEAAEAQRLHIERYHRSRFFALYDGKDLVALTVYRKGAEAVKARLEADAQTIADQQRQIEALKALTPRFREQITPAYRPPVQLPLLAAEDLTAYRMP